MSVGDPVDPVELVRTACETARIDPSGLRLIRHYSNAVVLVPSAGAVARVAMGRHDRAQLRRSLHVTRWLHQHHEYPTVVPLDDVDVVAVTPEASVSFWELLPQPDPPAPFDSADLARLLKRLHALPPPPSPVVEWQPLTSLEDALHGDTADVLSESERRWVIDRVTAVRERLTGREWPLGHGLVHGDAWLGNLMSSARGAALGDWDRVSRGPREVDLVPTWHAVRRYGRDRSWTDEFAAGYGYDLNTSPLFDDLMTMRDLAQLPGPLRRAPHSETHARALRQRLDDLLARDGTSSWVAL